MIIEPKSNNVRHRCCLFELVPNDWLVNLDSSVIPLGNQLAQLGTGLTVIVKPGNAHLNSEGGSNSMADPPFLTG